MTYQNSNLCNIYKALGHFVEIKRTDIFNDVLKKCRIQYAGLHKLSETQLEKPVKLLRTEYRKVIKERHD